MNPLNLQLYKIRKMSTIISISVIINKKLTFKIGKRCYTLISKSNNDLKINYYGEM